MSQNYLLKYDQPCSSTGTTSTGQTVIYSGYMGTDGKCHFFTRRVVDKSAFNGERQVWNDLTGYSNADGDSCALTNPDGSVSTGVLSGGKCVPASKGKGWDFANNLLNLASQYIGVRQDAASPNVTVNVPEQKKGMGTGAVIGIVAGIAVLGTIAYFVFKKK